MSSPPLSPAVASATAAFRQALAALRGLAKALEKRRLVASALAEAKVVLCEAEAALAGLEAALVAAMAAAARVTAVPGLSPESLYQALEAVANASAAELKRELSRNRRRRWGLWLGRTIALVLMLLCAPLREYGPV
ncbi:translation initiation factor if-2-like [Limosa lapponica baueri]|uniref:Translation initiation factor if-2-like n=1 Tax=Limosa lapponica baueri TaxID=1758121 RepID=A0A2I0T5A7_LIMLA|nr:translation initiation factor if-2-like [Limosa lapponica baueri]